jgi:hypothetical protein
MAHMLYAEEEGQADRAGGSDRHRSAHHCGATGVPKEALSKRATTFETEAALRTYASSLEHLLAHANKMKEEAVATKGETKKRHWVDVASDRPFSGGSI